MTDTPVQASDLREGDEVTITLKGVVEEIDRDGDLWLQVPKGRPALLTAHAFAIATTITRSPKPLGVGDRVKTSYGVGTIEAIATDWAWVSHPHHSSPATLVLSDLQRASPTQGEDQ